MSDSITKGIDNVLTSKLIVSAYGQSISVAIKDTGDGARNTRICIMDMERGRLSILPDIFATPTGKVSDINPANCEMKKTNKPWYNSFSKKKY